MERSGTADQIRAVFRGMPPAKRWTTLGVGAVTLVATIALVVWSQRPVYQVLFSGLAPEDAGKIVDNLKQHKVPYKIAAGGGTVLVPAERVYETRIEMAGDGMLQGGGVGFEIFDTPKLGMTDFVQKLNYQRAIQGELSRTIQSLDSVEKARVHTVMPKHSVFSEREELPSASVVLKLKPGRVLTNRQVTGIVQLVSSAVPGLSPERVNVLDSAGVLLSKNRGSSDEASSLAAVGLQHTIESSLEDRARKILEKTVGVGRVVVRVSADVNHRNTETTEEKYDPDSTVVRSEQHSEEKSSGSAATPRGIPGTPSNVPTPAGTPAAGSQTSSSSSSTAVRNNDTINYEISRIVSKASAPVVEIRRLTVAVLVDGTYANAKGAAGAPPVFAPRTTQELADYEKLVKNAVGFDAKRGDSFDIVCAPFVTEDAASAAFPKTTGSLPTIPPSYLTAAKSLSSVLIMLVVALFIVRPLIRGLTAAASAPEEPYPALLPAADRPAGELPRGAHRTQALGTGKEEIASAAKQEPARAAQAIKLWLVQE